MEDQLAVQTDEKPSTQNKDEQTELPANAISLDDITSENCIEGTPDENTEAKHEENTTGCDAELDPYSYTKKDQFTSEIFKIEIKNIPRKFGVGQFKKRLQNLKLDPVKIKPAGNNGYIFATFRNEEDRRKAIEVLNGHVWKGHALKAKFANPSADPLILKRKEEADHNRQDYKKKKVDNDLPFPERLRNAVAPYWSTPYEDQLQKKKEETVSYMKKLTREMDKNNPDMKQWLMQQRKLHNGMCCCLEDIKPSPILRNYRNKCEFTVGLSEDTKEKTVGFRLSSYRDGAVHVAPPEESWIVSETMANLVKHFEAFIRSSPYAVFDPYSGEGHWRQLTVRTTRKGDILAIAMFHPQSLSEEAVKNEKTSLLEYFTTGPGTSCSVTSLFFHIQTGRTVGASDNPNYELLYGKEHIYEQLLGMTFRISPDAFFQTNTLGAEQLYSTVAEWCDVGPKSHVLDICCGTGTIGLIMAKKIAKVIGIEMCQPAIDDAKYNADSNDISNVDFHCGKAEDVLPKLISAVYHKDATAVVDPPRAGLNNKVVLAIRKCHSIKRLVYVSCNPAGALNNLLDFTRASSKRVKGTPFKPVKAVPVDMFPHTKHYELVILLERMEGVNAETVKPREADATTA